MTEYLTEQEQIELLKNWVKQYSLVILAGVLIAVACISGWRYWQQRQTKIISHASSVYDELLTKRAQNDAAGTQAQAQKLFTHYSNTTYGPMAALMLARDAIIKKDYATGETHLNWALDHTRSSMREITRIRLARVYIAENKAEAALDLLKEVDDKNFAGLIDEVRGDAYLALKKPALARQAYQEALTKLPNAEVIRPLLQMKFDNLASVAPPSSSVDLSAAKESYSITHPKAIQAQNDSTISASASSDTQTKSHHQQV